MNVHFIAIGGAVMHNLAIALHKKGYTVTGSDDEIAEPSKTHLAQVGLLPEKIGWDISAIHNELDAVILGMHARVDNPELLRAQELGLKIYSYPEYIYEQTKDKIRIVIGGSHGKTTITAMILHVLKQCGKDFDYLIGAQVEGFDTMVKLTDSAAIAVFEGDEYLASPIDLRPKFLLYKPNIALLSGIAWDHINVFPTYEKYVEQFINFITCIEPSGSLIYCEDDSEVKKLATRAREDIRVYPYSIPTYKIENGDTYLIPEQTFNLPPSPFKLFIYGEHNLMNSNGARLVCKQVGISDDDFYKAISSFKGASKRLEVIVKNGSFAFYKDFAHSPSKVKATTNAVKKQFPDRKLIACLELHTFSSLNENFLKEYAGSMDAADEAIVYFNPHTIEHKKLKPITRQQVKDSFGRNSLKVVTDSKTLSQFILEQNWKNKNLLMMSSGTFDGMDLKLVGETIVAKKKKSIFIPIILFLFLLIGIAGGITAYIGYRMIYLSNVSLGDKKSEILFIPTGSNFNDVVQILSDENILKNKASFILLSGIKKYKDNIKPGKYRIRAHISNNELINLLRAGLQESIPVTFTNIRKKEQLVSRVCKRLEVDSTELLALLNNDQYLKENFGLKSETILVVFIPNTYKFQWNTSATQFVERMQVEYKKFWTPERKKKAEDINLSPSQVSILASIVQAEQMQFSDERSTIAGLYLNRIRIGMALQSDPTVIYATGDFTIHRVFDKN
ncbi:MAG: endolytic transglycosylase MltG, partial [Bacteroidota bacterium]